MGGQRFPVPLVGVCGDWRHGEDQKGSFELMKAKPLLGSRTENPRVGGSNPPLGSNVFNMARPWQDKAESYRRL